MEDLLKVGVITTTHGVRGEVKVFPTTDDAERFLDIEYVLLDTGKELRRLNIQNVKFFKNLAILKFEGIDNINDIEMYKGRELWIPREEAQELGEDEYYVADLIGMEVRFPWMIRLVLFWSTFPRWYPMHFPQVSCTAGIKLFLFIRFLCPF